MRVYPWAQISTPQLQDKIFLNLSLAKNASSSRAFRNLWLLLSMAHECHGTNKYFTTQTNILIAKTKTLTSEVYLTAEMIFALSGYLVSLTKYGGILSNLSLKTSMWTVRKTLVGTMFLEALSI